MNQPTVNTSIRITDGLRERIRRAAARSEMTRTDFIRSALERAVVEAEPQLSYHALQCEKQNEQGFPDREPRT